MQGSHATLTHCIDCCLMYLSYFFFHSGPRVFRIKHNILIFDTDRQWSVPASQPAVNHPVYSATLSQAVKFKILNSSPYLENSIHLHALPNSFSSCSVFTPLGLPLGPPQVSPINFFHFFLSIFCAGGEMENRTTYKSPRPVSPLWRKKKDQCTKPTSAHAAAERGVSQQQQQLWEFA